MSRSASIERNTSETKIKLSIDLDGNGNGNIHTGIGFFDHMLNAFARHGFFDLDVEVEAGWVIFVLILVGMCLKERFFCQYLCPMGAIFAWLPTLPFSVLDRDRSNCIPKCRACEIKCPVDHQIKRDQKNGGECIHCMQCVDVCPKQNIHLCSGKKLKGNEILIILLKLVLFIGVCIFAQSL